MQRYLRKIPLSQRSLTISVAYLLLGLLWIFFSDRLALAMFKGSGLMHQIQTYKGFFYIGLTAILLYVLINNLFQRLHRGQKEMDLVFRSPDLGLFKIDVWGDLLYVSRSVEGILGYSAEELLGENVSMITSEEDKETEQGEFVELLKLRETHFNMAKAFKHKDGSQRILLINGMLMRDKKGLVESIVAVFQNITMRQEHLMAIERQNEQLKEIAWTQSHLVRAPLSRLMGLADLLNQEGTSAEEREEMLNYLKIEANDLDQVIRSITNKSTENVSDGV